MIARRLLPALALLGCAVLAGCSSSSTIPALTEVAVVRPAPPESGELTERPQVEGEGNCGDPEASLPKSTAIPPGSPLAQIKRNGKLVVGVDQNTYLFGFRDPDSGALEGFDIDIAKEIGRDLLGDPNLVELRSVTAADRITALRSGQVDLIVRTFSATCERRRDVDFSTVYFRAQQRIMTLKDSRIESSAQLAGKRVCATRGTTAPGALFALPQPPTVFGVTNWTDCLIALQQGQVDAISADEPILVGLIAQDRNLRIVGESIGSGAYAVGVAKGSDDLVRYVNAVLDRIRVDGTWQRIYNQRLSALGQSTEPPQPKYVQ